ncbi:MAG: hypothetical protein U1F29_08880 [Planctomycetota bacterium]
MNLATSLVFLAGAAALTVWAVRAGPDSNTPVHAAESASSVAGASKRIEPTREGVEARSRARWEAVCRGDWIAAYDFQTAEQKHVPLAQFLQGKDHHVYANPAIERVISVGRTDAYLLVRVVWTPTHPELQRVRLQPGETLTEEIRLVETWRWEGSEWGFVRGERVEEFYAAHPELTGK